MTKSVYSFGAESPLKFTLSDALAKNYNLAVEEFFRARQRFNQKFNHPWDPTENPITIRWTKDQQKAWDEVAAILTQAIENAGGFHATEIMDDYLVKNVDASASLRSSKWKRYITLAAAFGALYGYLRGL